MIDLRPEIPELIWEDAPDLPGNERVAKYSVSALREVVHRLWDLQIDGLKNVPETGPAILCPNHLSFCDSVFVPLSVPRRIWAIGKGEYLDDWKTKHLFPALGMIPVDRSGGDAAKVALDAAARVLEGGHLFMIYPEGTRSRSGNLHKARTGAARLALRCNAPIIPVGHTGTLAVQPPDQFMMKPGLSVEVRFGAPMHIEDHGDPNDPRSIRAMSDAVMFEIAQLSGQTYVNTYAGSEDESRDTPARPQAPSTGPTRPAGRGPMLAGPTSPLPAGA